MESTHNQIVPQRKTLWSLVKTMFIPAQNIAKLMIGCGGKRGKGRRRLSIKNMQQAREAFVRGSLRRRESNRFNSEQISPPPSRNDVTSSLQENELHPVSISTSEARNSQLQSPCESSVMVNAQIIASDASTHEQTLNSASASSGNPSLSAPLNLEEAEFLLESLTLHCHSNHTNGNKRTNFPATISEISDLDGFELSPESFTVPSPVHEGNDDENSLTTGVVAINEHIFEDSRLNACSDGEVRSRRSTSFSSSDSPSIHSQNNVTVVMRRSNTTVNFRSQDGESEFNGWRKSSIEVTSNPPVTLGYLPCGLCIGDRIVWVNDDHPEIGTVRWIGKIREQFYAGIEFDKPVGNSSGIYGYGMGMHKRLFTCKLPYGRFVPVKELVLYRDYHDPGVKSGIVCIICRDDFLDTWDTDSSTTVEQTADGDDLQPFNMVSTKCGHLYHWGCLSHWFSTKKRYNEFHCPFCSRSMDGMDIIRIFPSQA